MLNVSELEAIDTALLLHYQFHFFFFSVLVSQRKCSQFPVLSKRLRTSMVGSGSIYRRLTLDPVLSLVWF